MAAKKKTAKKKTAKKKTAKKKTAKKKTAKKVDFVSTGPVSGQGRPREEKPLPVTSQGKA